MLANFGRMVRSLFTSAGSISPLAIVIYAGMAGYAYLSMTNYFEQREALRQSEVRIEAEKSKLENYKRLKNAEKQIIESIDPDNINAWVNDINRLQSDFEKWLNTSEVLYPNTNTSGPDNP